MYVLRVWIGVVSALLAYSPAIAQTIPNNEKGVLVNKGAVVVRARIDDSKGKKLFIGDNCFLPAVSVVASIGEFNGSGPDGFDEKRDHVIARYEPDHEERYGYCPVGAILFVPVEEWAQAVSQYRSYVENNNAIQELTRQRQAKSN